MLNKDFKDAIDSLQSNPVACGAFCLRALEELSNGEVKVVDPSNPFVYLMETSVILYTNSLDRCANNLNRLYESNASNYQDLYRHMSDTDYVGRFSSPGQAPIMFFIDVEEIKKKAVDVGDGTGNRKLTISRNSQILTSDVKLTFLYPVDIIITNFNTITVKYNIDNKNPLQSISDTIIHSELRRSDKTTYLFFEVPVLQVEIISTTFSVTGTQGLKKTIKFNDKFYYLRAFMRNDEDEGWDGVTVKHNPIVVDNNEVTVVVNVDTIRNELTIQIPQIYKNMSMLKDNIRVDVYTTQGDIVVPLFNINDTLFKASWQDHETTTPDKFSAPMSNLNNYRIASDGEVTGGSNGLTFSELRDRVINRSVVTEGFPISFNHLATKLSDSGFNTIVTKDNVTDREFLSTRLLSDPEPYQLNTTPIGSLTITHATTIERMLDNTDSVRGNINQLTVLPSAVYELVDGKLESLSDSEVTSLLLQRNQTSIDSLVNSLNTRKLYYCPYFMVHDYKDDRYVVKPYRLDRPKIVTKSIENENLLLGYSSNIIAYNIQIDSGYSGYSIYVQINPSDEMKNLPTEDILMQMRIGDENGRYYYWFNGVLVTPINGTTGKPESDYYVYRFHLPTNWSITDDDELLIGGYNIPFKLNGNADIYTIVRKSELGNNYRSDMDNYINPNLLDGWTTSNSGDYYSIVQERVNIVLGEHMEHLWRQQRSAIEETEFETYASDVYAVWEEVMYAKDEYGNDLFTIDGNNNLIKTIEHEIGDPKLDEFGDPILLHSAGDNVIDNDGLPVIVGGVNGIVRHHDLVLLDGKYYFSNHDRTIEYRESVKDEIDSWMDIMGSMKGELLERTTIYTHPKITEGLVRVILDGGLEGYIDSTQSLVLTYTVDERIGSNTSIIDEIKIATVEVIHDIFSDNTTISKSDIVKGLKDRMADWIIGVNISGFLGDEYETVSILDSSIALSIPKRLAITTNLELIVENDILINFVTHSTLSV